ncbi:MAG TPA: L,D-transpeptidase [Acidimicrobiales bacterium]|nr:L,D-transpeptidase [Acidimicrobiales bacterium]
MSAMLSDPWVAAWTGGGSSIPGAATAEPPGPAVRKRFSILRWILIAGVLALGIGSDEARPPMVPTPSVPAAAVAEPATTAAPLRATTDAPPAPSKAEATLTPPPPAPPAADLSVAPPYVVATTSAPVAVHQVPEGASASRVLDPAAEVGGQLVFLVKQETPDWLEVYLPLRPNGSTGWLRSGEVELYEHDYRIELSLSERRLVLFEGAAVVMEEPIGVGGDQTPTPGGIYYLKELLRPPDPAGFYGPYAYGLSGFSNVLTDFAGGEGVIGLHGTNDPSSVGRNVSNGCIRMANTTITRLVEQIGLPLGTPVVVKA